MNKKVCRNIIVFIFIVIISGWIGALVDSVLIEKPEGDTLGMGIWMISPMLTLIAITIFSKGNWKDIGFKPNFKGNVKWYFISTLFFPVVTAIVLIIGAATKWIDLSAFDLKLFILVFSSTLLFNFIRNIFEETAWRGYLTSQLLKLNVNDLTLYLIVGSVWGIWHIPYYLFFLPEAVMSAVFPFSRPISSIVATITMMCWAVMFIELYRVTKSIWPVVTLHMVEDSLVNPLVLSYISIAAGKEILISPIYGIITSILYLFVGFGIRTYRRQANQMNIENFDKPYTLEHS